MLILMLIFTGCGGIPEPEDTPVVSSIVEEGQEHNIIQGESLSEIIEACKVDLQESALLKDQIPDWSDLPISACYQLWLEIEVDPREYKGKAEITLINSTQELLDELVFRVYPNADLIYGGSLEVTSADISGDPTQPELFLEDETGLRLTLEEPIQPGEIVTVKMEFNGLLTDGLQDSPGTYGLFNYSKEDEVATYVNWYPILAPFNDRGWFAEPVIGIGDAVVSEVGLYLVEVTAPDEYQVVTGGTLIDQESQEGIEKYLFASGPVRDFPVVASPNLSPIQDEVDGVLVRHWGLPGGEERWDEALKSSIDSLKVFNQLFGPYPYRELDIAVVPLQLASGVEYPGMVLMRDDLYEDSQDRSSLLTTIISHETAHQWWYGLVGNDVLENPWQDEALTSFSSLLYLEHVEPEVNQGTISYFEQARENVDKELTNSDVSQPVAAFVQQPENYSPVVYLKGAVFFLELREKIGDKVFFDALQEYFSNNKYSIATPEKLLGAFEKSCRCELDEFFDDWGVE